MQPGTNKTTTNKAQMSTTDAMFQQDRHAAERSGPRSPRSHDPQKIAHPRVAAPVWGGVPECGENVRWLIKLNGKGATPGSGNDLKTRPDLEGPGAKQAVARHGADRESPSLLISYNKQ